MPLRMWPLSPTLHIKHLLLLTYWFITTLLRFADRHMSSHDPARNALHSPWSWHNIRVPLMQLISWPEPYRGVGNIACPRTKNSTKPVFMPVFLLHVKHQHPWPWLDPIFLCLSLNAPHFRFSYLVGGSILINRPSKILNSNSTVFTRRDYKVS